MRFNSLQFGKALRSVLFILLLSVVGMEKVYADYYDVTIGDLRYSLHDETLTAFVIGHASGWNATGSLTIPESVTYLYESYSVIGIENSAFIDCCGLTGNLTIPNSVTMIGSGAFSGCSGFTGSLTIPNSVTYIGGGAFRNCTGFTGSLTIPDSVTTIEAYAFEGCSGFTGSLTIPNFVTTLGCHAFSGCNGLTEVHFNASNCNDYDGCSASPFFGCSGPLSLYIGNNVERIPAYIFNSGYESIFTGSLTIPNSVTTIGEYAFHDCSGFTGSLTIGNSVTEIGIGAFSGCSGFTGNLTIGNSVTEIGIGAFSGCSGFTEVYFNATNCADSWDLYSSCFSDCGGSLVFGDNVERIPSYMFRFGGFTGSVTISNSVTEIGYGAFEECTGFTGVYYTGDIAQWCNISFGNIYSNPLYYAHNLFINNSLVTNLVIPETITEIKNCVFAGGSCFTDNLIIPSSVASIGSYAFTACSGFTGNLIIPNSVTTIGISAFYGCRSFTGSLAIGNSVTSIGLHAFRGCSGFTGNLTIGNSVTEIGDSAFQGCSGFSSIQSLSETPPIAYGGAFSGMNYSIPVIVPCGSLYAYQNASGWTEFTNIQEDCGPLAITAIANPTNGGTVTGGGTYIAGATCTLTATPNEEYGFTNWIKDGTVVSTCATYSFTVTQNATFVANFSEYHSGDDITQTTTFNNGWNWWSSYIELSDTSLGALQGGLGTSGEMIKSQNNGYASYLSGFGWYGSLTSLNNQSTYQVKTNGACTVEMTGSAANSTNHPITLNSGWTWVGYPVNASMSVAEALSGIVPQNNDMLKSQNNGYASYLAGFGWYGSLSTLQPGMGLMFKSNNSSPVTLVYPNNGTRTNLKANQTTENNHYRPNLNTYPDNMSVMAIVEVNDEELRSENYELAVFANGECRGSAKLMYVEPLNRYMAFLTVAGDEAAELHFGLYNTETGAVKTQNVASLQYETNAVVGSFVEPYVVSFRSTTGVGEWANNLQIFPNPVEHGQTISLGKTDEMGMVQVEIINALGMVVETCHDASLQSITAPNVAGVYTLKITVEDKGSYFRKLVVR